MPLVTVAIPTFNRHQLLPRAIRSALEQEEPADFEVLVVDDGSTDDTPALLARLSHPRLRTERSRQHRGMAHAWNRAIALSRGQFVLVLQDDDYLLPHCVRAIARAAAAHPEAGLIVSPTVLTDLEDVVRWRFWGAATDELLPAPEAFQRFVRAWTISATQVAFRRSLAGNEPFDPSLPVMSDAEPILGWMLDAATLLLGEAFAVRTLWDGSTTATARKADLQISLRRLVDKVAEQAARSGRFTERQLGELSRDLQRTFSAPAADQPSGYTAAQAELRRSVSPFPL